MVGRDAGRPAVARPIVHHVKRPVFPAEGPAHVALRVRDDLPSLRTRCFVREFQRSLRQVCERDDFRAVHYSLQHDHVHMIVEAADNDAMGREMMSVTSRLATR